jgi:hypothetical protein
MDDAPRDLSLTRDGSYIAYATEPLMPLDSRIWGVVEVCSAKSGELVTSFLCK